MTNNKVAIVTGAAGDIGCQVVVALLEQGHRVACFDLIKPEFSGIFQKRCNFIRVDLTNRSEVRKKVQEVQQSWGCIHYLVNCAGNYNPVPFANLEESQWDSICNVNLNGTFWTCQAVAQHMVRGGGGGRIINMSSSLAQTGGCCSADYAASKGGVEGLTRTLALELASYGITVNAVAPGAVDSTMARKALGEAELSKRAELHPLGRLTSVHEVVEVIIFLLGPDSSFITGQVFQVNGGSSMF